MDKVDVGILGTDCFLKLFVILWGFGKLGIGSSDCYETAVFGVSLKNRKLYFNPYKTDNVYLCI